MLALRQYINDVGNEVRGFRMLKNVPNNRMSNLRNEMYVISEAIRLIEKSGKTEFDADDRKILANYKKHIDLATKFIPSWVKVAVAIALGLGTMIGWKRIVVTVGEKIGKKTTWKHTGRALRLKSRRWSPSVPPICWACRSVRRTCFRREWRARWRRTIPGCNGGPCAIC